MIVENKTDISQWCPFSGKISGGIQINPGKNTIDSVLWDKVKKSPWVKLLLERKNLVVIELEQKVKSVDKIKNNNK